MNNRSWGEILLSIFLILWGVLRLSNITFVYAFPVLAALALCAGVLRLLGK